MMKTLFFETIDSTNSFLKRHYKEYEDMTFVSAGLQSAGRGRNNRRWSASKGKNLTFSLLIKDKEVMEAYQALSVVSAYSIVKTLEAYGIKDLKIKWPNDVYVKDAKICGILLEGVSVKEMECLIIGIGLNVNEEVFEKDLLHEAVSMKLVLNRSVDLQDLKEKVYRDLCDYIEKVKKKTDLYPEIGNYDYLKGKSAYCKINGFDQKIEVIGIDEDYSLKVICDNQIMNLSSSEVTFHL